MVLGARRCQVEESQRSTRDELLESLRRLSDDELVARLKSLAARERRATALLVAHLAELDTRDLHLRAGYPSLFVYCREVLALSEHEAYNRMEVARTARRLPVVLDMLAEGAVNLTTVRLLGPHLTAENHAGVLESARGKRKSEVEEIVARLSPRPDVPASVRKLPEGQAATSASAPGSPSPAVSAVAVNGPSPVPAERSLPSTGCPQGHGQDLQAPAVPAPRACHDRVGEVTPLSPGRYRYQLTIGGTTLEKLRLAKDMLRHALPSGDDEAILDRALTVLLEDLARKRFGSGERSGSDEKARPSRKTGTDSRRVPASVKRAVWVRDLGRCAFVAADGRRCGERAFVELHHLRPYAVGGEATVENIQLRCREHNRYEARVFLPRPEDRDFVLERVGAGGAAVCRSAGLNETTLEQLPPDVGAAIRSVGLASRNGLSHSASVDRTLTRLRMRTRTAHRPTCSFRNESRLSGRA
jgi:hypothetical protein